MKSKFLSIGVITVALILSSVRAKCQNFFMSDAFSAVNTNNIVYQTDPIIIEPAQEVSAPVLSTMGEGGGCLHL